MRSLRKPESGATYPIQIWGRMMIYSAFTAISFLPFVNDGAICLAEVVRPKPHFEDNYILWSSLRITWPPRTTAFCDSHSGNCCTPKGEEMKVGLQCALPFTRSIRASHRSGKDISRNFYAKSEEGLVAK